MGCMCEMRRDINNLGKHHVALKKNTWMLLPKNQEKEEQCLSSDDKFDEYEPTNIY